MNSAIFYINPFHCIFNHYTLPTTIVWSNQSTWHEINVVSRQWLHETWYAPCKSTNPTPRHASIVSFRGPMIAVLGSCDGWPGGQHSDETYARDLGLHNILFVIIHCSYLRIRSTRPRWHTSVAQAVATPVVVFTLARHAFIHRDATLEVFGNMADTNIQSPNTLWWHERNMTDLDFALIILMCVSDKTQQIVHVFPPFAPFRQT